MLQSRTEYYAGDTCGLRSPEPFTQTESRLGAHMGQFTFELGLWGKIKMQDGGDRKMAQWLKALAALTEDPGSILSPH